MHSNTHTLLTVIMIINNDNNHITSYTYIYIFYIWLYLFLSVVWKKANLYQRYPLSIAICWEFDCSKSRPWWQSTAPRDMKVWILTSPGPTNWRGELSELLVIAIVFRVKLGFPSTNWSWYNIYIYSDIYYLYILSNMNEIINDIMIQRSQFSEHCEHAAMQWSHIQVDRQRMRAERWSLRE